jgi:hypothetical protein
VLNDDLVVLHPGRKGWCAAATPFWHTGQVPPTPGEAPLALFLRLVQDQRVYLEPLSQAECMAEVLSAIPVVLQNPHRGQAALDRVLDLARQVPSYRLHFLPDASFWKCLDPLLGSNAR